MLAVWLAALAAEVVAANISNIRYWGLFTSHIQLLEVLYLGNSHYLQRENGDGDTYSSI